MDEQLPAEQVVTFRSGITARVRPIQPCDVPALQAFHSRLSPNTTRLRFFTPMRRLAPAFARHLCTVDFVRRAAFVVSDAGSNVIRAVGRYEAMTPGSAELAFVVEDAFQGQGLGVVVLDRLVGHARSQGYHELTAVVLCENANMLALFRESPYPAEITASGDCAFVTLDIRQGGPRLPRPLAAIAGRRPLPGATPLRRAAGE